MKSVIEIKIRGYHTDAFRHVNNARYLEFMEEGRWDYFEKHHLIEWFHKKKILHAVVQVNINYRQSACVGQVIRLETRLAAKGRKSIVLNQDICLSTTGTKIAEARVTHVFISRDTGQTLRVDDALADAWPQILTTASKEPLNRSRVI